MPASSKPKPHFYLAVASTWFTAMTWFAPRWWEIVAHSEGIVLAGLILQALIFAVLAWYALHNLAVVAFAFIVRRERHVDVIHELEQPPEVAILYTTCNDLSHAAVSACLGQDYRNFHVFILDDGDEGSYQSAIDRLAREHGGCLTVVRRENRAGYKAGNLNHALETVCHAEFFALVDADEVLPADFLRRAVPLLVANERLGYVQASHRCNPRWHGALAHSLGIGVDVHWRWYQPLRNTFGFVPLLGHGALVRRRAWNEACGFPECVSEDLAFSVRLGRLGYRGRFAEHIVCYEDFPRSMRAFRVRYMKWVRGTCQFIMREIPPLLASTRVSWVEKCDILLPTLHLPLSGALFAGVLLLSAGGLSVGRPAVGMWNDLGVFVLVMFVAPLLCFVFDLWRSPAKLWRLLCESTVAYAGSAALSVIGTLGYAATRQASFLVTGDARPTGGDHGFAADSHPDSWMVQLAECSIGLATCGVGAASGRPSLFGLGVAIVLHPLLHRTGWDAPSLRFAKYAPFWLIATDALLLLRRVMFAHY